MVQAGPAAATRRTGRLSEGTLVEASVVGRVLGMRILKLDAVVLLSPAAAPPVSVTPAPSIRPRAGRLAGALRSIEEGAALLEEARRLGQSDGVVPSRPGNRGSPSSGIGSSGDA